MVDGDILARVMVAVCTCENIIFAVIRSPWGDEQTLDRPGRTVTVDRGLAIDVARTPNRKLTEN
jgi:hypothetical protein